METLQKERSYVYPHGSPFSQVLEISIDSLMDRIKRNKASMILIDGNVGEGKTTLGVLVGDYVNKKFGHMENIDLHGQLAMGGKDFGEKLLVCHEEKKAVLIYDESGDFDKKTTISRFNRNLMRVFEMYRGFKILIILCLPKFYKLENELFEIGIVRMLLHVEGRTENQGNFRVFDLEQMYYIKHHAQKIIVKPKCYDFGVPNFYGHFLNLPPDRSDELDRISIANKRKEVKKTVYDVKNRVTLEMIMAHFKKSHFWVRKKMKELDDIGDVKLFEKKKWYLKEILERIEELEE